MTTEKELKALAVQLEDRWRLVRPIAVMSGSDAQVKNVFNELKDDLFKLINGIRNGHLVPSGRVEELEAEVKRIRDERNRLLIDLLMIGGTFEANFDALVEAEQFPIQDLEPEDRMMLSEARERLTHWQAYQKRAYEANKHIQADDTDPWTFWRDASGAFGLCRLSECPARAALNQEGRS